MQSGKFKEELEEAFAAVKRKMAKLGAAARPLVCTPRCAGLSPLTAAARRKERKSVGDERRSKKEKHRHKKRKRCARPACEGRGREEWSFASPPPLDAQSRTFTRPEPAV